MRTLEDYNATLEQEITRYSGEGAPVPPDSWPRRVEEYDCGVTEDFEAQGILNYVEGVNEGRVSAEDEPRLLSARFKLAFDTMRNLSDYARLVAGLRAKNVEVETLRYRSRIEESESGVRLSERLP